MDSSISIFKSGVQNLLNNEVIPEDAAQDSLGFINQDGKLKLVGGRLLTGADSGVTGMIRGLWFGYTVAGTQILYRKTETKLQYLLSGTWTDVLTGLTSGSEYSFANYSSVAGAFTFFVGTDGYWKINNANPGSPIQMYDATKNFHGTIFIDKGRTILWNRRDPNTKDLTGLYGSRIDPQNNTVYTTVTGETVGASGSTLYAGTLAFKAGGATRNAFGVQLVQIPVVTISIASPAVVTLNAHGFLGGETIQFQTTGALPTGLTAATNYFVLAAGLTANTFQISATAGGTPINTSVSQSGVQTITSTSLENFTDNFNGVLTSNKGGTGTINYATGVYSATFALTTIGPVTTNYQWEDSNQKGLTDFTKSATRLAGEGFVVPQDQGGDPIMNVLIGQDGAYYSLKQQSAYQFTMDDTDLNPTNQIYYANMGVPSNNAGISTDKGIIFINTSNPDKPEMTILQKNLVTSNLLPVVLFPAFKFSNYDFSDCYFNTYERYVTVSCKKMGSVQNDTILLCNISDGTVDISPYEARMFAKDNLANLYVGSPLTQNVYQIYNGFDDLGNPINNFWIGAGDQYGSLKLRMMRWRFIREELKKFRKYNVKGTISTSQTVQVWFSFDDAAFQLAGTIVGNGSYVDSATSQAIGSNFIGQAKIGGDTITNAYPFFCQIKFKMPKFRKRTVKFVATGIGYFDINFLSDFDLMLFENRIPARFRSKQKVSVDGTQTNL